jgi:ATP/ADP translocase
MPGVRSLATSFVHADQVSRLYAVIAVIQTVGRMLSGPIVARAFSWGVELGGPWIGMIFIVTAGIVLVFGIPVWIIRPPKPEEDVHG